MASLTAMIGKFNALSAAIARKRASFKAALASGVTILPATFGPKAAVMGAVSLILSGVVNLDFEHVNNTARR